MEKSNTRLFPIGEVARMFHLSVGTLRHYEKKGLLEPEYIDENTGYRYYSTRQFECLNTIRYLRVLDMPLEQIREFLKNRDTDRIQEMLQQQKEAVIRKQQELQIIEWKINNRMEQIKDALSSELDHIHITSLPPRRIAMIEANALVANSYLDLEDSIRKLEKNQKESVVFLGKVGVGISVKRLKNKIFDKYDMVFILLDPEDLYQGSVTELEEENCAVIRFRGSHKEAEIYYEKLVNYIQKNNMEISGFSKEITMIDYGMTNDTSKFVTEIQIPIQKVED